MTARLDRDGYPTSCCLCSERIVKTKTTGGLRFYMDDVSGDALSWHVVCEHEKGHPELAGAKGVQTERRT